MWLKCHAVTRLNSRTDSHDFVAPMAMARMPWEYPTLSLGVFPHP